MSADRAETMPELVLPAGGAEEPGAGTGTGFGLRNSLFHQLAEACPVLIAMNSAGQPIVYASPALRALSGHSAQELAGRDWRKLFGTDADRSDPPGMAAALAAPGVWRTFCATHQSGAPLWLNVKAVPQQNDWGFVTHHIVLFHDVTAEHRLRATLEYRAHHDALTGVANRHLLRDRFEHAVAFAKRHQSGFTVVLIDLDGFKRINDGFGHDAGDAVLQCVADRLKQSIRGEDTLARLGGDEFCLLLAEGRASDELQKALGRITGSVMQPVPWGADTIPLSCCIGSSQYPGEGRSLEELLKIADERLYSMKDTVPGSPRRTLTRRATELPAL